MYLVFLAMQMATASPTMPVDAPTNSFQTGNQFEQFCDKGTEQHLLCMLYAKGLWDGAIAFHPVACLPAGVTTTSC
jgi:hypothetical protein